MEDNTFKTLAIKNDETCGDIIELMAKKLNLRDSSGCSLILQDSSGGKYSNFAQNFSLNFYPDILSTPHEE